MNTYLTLWLLIFSDHIYSPTYATENNVCYGENVWKPSQNKPKKDIEEKLTFTTLFGQLLDSKLGKRTQQFIEDIEKTLESRQTNNNGGKNDTKKENKFALLNEIRSDVRKIAAYVEETKQVKHFPKNCQEVLKMGNTVSGIYTIRPNYASQGFDVRCEMDSRGGGWTYLLNRFDGSQDFFLSWEAYKKGFGRLAGEFWCGLESLHELTGFEDNELLIELVDWNDDKVYAMYDSFRLGKELEGYPIITLGEYNGNAGDSLRYHVNAKFSTKDRDSSNCSNTHHGAWWYKNCWRSHLTGVHGAKESNGRGMSWETYRGRNYSLRKARMLIRPRNREI